MNDPLVDARSAWFRGDPLAVLAALADDERPEALALRSEAASLLGDHRTALELAEAAVAGADAVFLPEARAVQADVLSSLNRDDDALAICHGLPATGRPAGRAALVRAVAAARSGQLSRAEGLYDEARRHFAAAGDLPNEALTLSGHSQAELFLGSRERALELATEALASVRGRGHLELVVRCALLRTRSGDLAADWAALAEQARATGSTRVWGVASSSWAEELAPTDPEAAASGLEPVRDALRAIDPRRANEIGVQIAICRLLAASRDGGQPDRVATALAAVTRARSALEARNTLHAALDVAASLGMGLEGSWDEAAQALHQALVRSAHPVPLELLELVVAQIPVARSSGFRVAANRLRVGALILARRARHSPIIDALRAELVEEGTKNGPIPLDDLVLHTPIGRGGMGEVWRATRDGRPVAVKLITAASARRPGAEARFRAEVSALAGLGHVHVVPVSGAGEVGEGMALMTGDAVPEGSPYLVMPLASGSLLPHCGWLPWERIRTVTLALLDALGAAHAAGMLHLDVKPENVLLADGHRIWLADFGLARAVGEGGAIGGSPPYMAPERFSRKAAGKLDATVDLYGLACLVWELVTGRPPFDAEDVTGQRLAHLGAAPPPLSPCMPVPEGLEAWLLRNLAKYPEDRFASAGEAAFALRELGPATSPGVSAPADRVACHTFVLDDPGEEEPVVPTVEGLAPRVRPPVPPSWRDIAKTDRSDPAPGLELFEARRPPPAGREGILDALWDDVRALAHGEGGAVVLHALPAFGASDLVEDFRRLAARTGAVRTWSTSGPGRVSSDGLARWLADEGPPGLVILDALPAEIDALRTVLDAAPAPRLVVVLVHDDQPDDATREALERLGGRSVSIGPVETGDLVAMARSLLPLAPDLARAAAERAEGEPWALVTQLRRWVRDGDLVGLPTGYALRDPEVLRASPGTPRPSLVDDLGRDHAALAVLACGPRHVRLDDFAAVLETLSLAWPADGIERLVGLGLLDHSDGLAFRDRGLRAHLASGATDPSAVHGAWAAGLAERDSTEAAAHLEAAGRAEEAIPVLLGAIADALVEGRTGDAERHLERVDRSLRQLGIGEAHPWRVACDALVAQLAPLVDQTADELESLAGRCEAAGRPIEAALTWRRIARRRRFDGDVRAALDACCEIRRVVPGTRLAGDGLALAGAVGIRHGDPRAPAWLAEGLALLEAVGARAEAEQYRAAGAHGRGDDEGARAAALRAESLAEAPRSRSLAQLTLGRLALERGDRTEARLWFRRSIDTGRPVSRDAMAQLALARLDFEEGHLAGVERAIRLRRWLESEHETLGLLEVDLLALALDPPDVERARQWLTRLEPQPDTVDLLDRVLADRARRGLALEEVRELREAFAAREG